MRRRARVLTAVCLLGLPAAAGAAGIRAPFPVAVRARLDVAVLAVRDAGEWTVTTRSPADASRFMADVTAGNRATGVLYVKGASSWSGADDDLGRVRFDAEQGDYLHGFAWSDSARADLRVFADERRFLTHEQGVAVVDEDIVDDYEHRVGVRADARLRVWRATYWIAGLDTGDERRTSQYGSLRFATAPVFAGVGYLNDAPDSGPDQAIAKAEAAAYFRAASAIASFELSGETFPSGDWGDFEAGSYSSAAPSNSATFVELRTRRTRVGENHMLDASYRYDNVGAEYRNDLSPRVPGSVAHAAWVDWAHRRYALDARLAVRSRVESVSQPGTWRSVDLTARARMTDNAEWLLRGGAARDESLGRNEEAGFAHLAYTRELREFLGGVHVLLDDIGEDTALAAGAEVRLNWSATGAISGRWIAVDEAGGSDAFWVRLEFRPTRRTWVTAVYGRETRGDDVYFLEDRDAPPAAGTGDVITFSLRGDL
jgi:hypothetical protein